jgi:hypothetical protein
MENTLHAGKLLQQYIRENKVSKAALSRAMGISPSSLEGRLKKESFKTDTLLKISNLLEHNFFADIAASLPKEFPTNGAVDKTKDELIAALELEIKMLKREREVLSSLISAKIN